MYRYTVAAGAIAFALLAPLTTAPTFAQATAHVSVEALNPTEGQQFQATASPPMYQPVVNVLFKSKHSAYITGASANQVFTVGYRFNQSRRYRTSAPGVTPEQWSNYTLFWWEGDIYPNLVVTCNSQGNWETKKDITLEKQINGMHRQSGIWQFLPESFFSVPSLNYYGTDEDPVNFTVLAPP